MEELSWKRLEVADSGAILAIGRGGRETTLWPAQKSFLDKKLVIQCVQTNIRRWIKRSFVQNAADKAPWRGSECSVNKKWEKWSAQRDEM